MHQRRSGELREMRRNALSRQRIGFSKRVTRYSFLNDIPKGQ